MKLFKFLFISILLFTASNVLSQNQVLNFITMPNSVPSFGMGGQSVALMTGKDALTFNPANLVYTEGVQVSFFRQPFQIIGRDMPLTNFTASLKYKDVGVIGVEYRRHYLGRFSISTFDNPTPIKYVENIDESFTLGFAKRISGSISVGGAIKYSQMEYAENKPDLFSVSLGMNYNFKLFDRPSNLGFSIMNLGSAVKSESKSRTGETVTHYNSPPTNLNLGLYSEPVSNNYYSLGVQLGFSKPFDNSNGDEAKSSFKTLFSDWDDFPNDAILNTGVGFIWKPLNLGNNFYVWQEFYFGNNSKGIDSRLANIYTHGALVGVEYSGIKFTMGYAGYWHNAHFDRYLRWDFPYETFQFSFGISEDYLWGSKKRKKHNTLLQQILISAGAGYSNKVGRFAKINEALSYKNGISYYIDAAFYISNRTALKTTFIYHPYDVKFQYLGDVFLETKFETMTFLSSIKYHPIDAVDFLFFETGFGVYRWNPVYERTRPKYDYNAIFSSGIGTDINLFGDLILTPTINWLLTFEQATGPAPRMQGLNQFDFVIKAGYAIR